MYVYNYCTLHNNVNIMYSIIIMYLNCTLYMAVYVRIVTYNYNFYMCLFYVHVALHAVATEDLS